ncbi:hypothetical protein CYLTODRAFT_231369 [Cylindrobasidium torrendii FP15055 ss-10]|uniref:Uncharacterized protein n=1 Tax=Cylindrobasidium torrendii FP15055 ss-10 TaxID=1314674 RepID=A0A0D7AVK5_9AGAR|nr:hypothetical protein CYLTODRAFT_231369 [Cylindrobasidium torrendii FP15055 ss-10]
MSPTNHHQPCGGGKNCRKNSLRRTQDYLPKLFPLAEKLNAKRLDSISMEKVLAGGTCYPISLSEFELYLAYNEDSIEQLQFVVWYRDYRRRVEAMLLPGRGESQASLLSASTASKLTTLTGSPELEPMVIIDVDFLKRTGGVFDVALRDECMRVVATFLLPNSLKSLDIDTRTREDILRGPEDSCHYEVFEALYRQTYSGLEKGAFPRFLAHAMSNINMPKQLLWYAMGVMFSTIALVSAATIIRYVPPPKINRVYRLIPLIPFGLGIIAFGEAFLGFCSQTYHRDGRQIHTWELRQLDDEAARYVASLRARTADVPLAVVCNATDGSYTGKTLSVAARTDTVPKSDVRLARPAFFGPEQVVQDETVLKAQRRLMNDLLAVTLCGVLLFAAVIFSIPGHST